MVQQLNIKIPGKSVYSLGLYQMENSFIPGVSWTDVIVVNNFRELELTIRFSINTQENLITVQNYLTTEKYEYANRYKYDEIITLAKEEIKKLI